MTACVLIVGGGLAGMTAAHLLHRVGVRFVLFEAAERLGGRILTLPAPQQAAMQSPDGKLADGFDLGPSWVWPDMQPGLRDFIAELGLATFPQYETGDVMVERGVQPPTRMQGFRQVPQAMRLAGGTGAIIGALAAGLPAKAVFLRTRVTSVSRSGAGLQIGFLDAQGAAQTLGVTQAILALPPRLLAATVAFSPALAPATLDLWQRTPTWMAPHAKVIAVYERPFWRDSGLSGAARSTVGPLVEVHDATTSEGQAALFGFVGVPAAQRAAVGPQAVIAAAIHQLVLLFGPRAGAPVATLIKDWAADPLVATPMDLLSPGHPEPIADQWLTGDWRAAVTLAGSETSDTAPGYLAGAVDAGQRAGRAVISRLS